MFRPIISGLNLMVLLSALFLGVTAHCEASEESETKIYWLCKNKKEVRTIRVQVNPKSRICSTLYSKLGEEKVVGSGRNYDSCVGFLTSIKANLGNSNWTCRDISSTKITAMTE